ncbi:MAG: ATP-grasp domain-containing protein [Halanaerobiales bacterium]|nr:ATP-grasp domain-containing protein [Halanaerobiales bacterium]
MKLLVLGGGRAQLSAIKKTKELGHQVIVSDYLKDAPGRALADHAELVSTFDIKDNVRVGRKYDIDGVMTIGTDQPVYTAAAVADKLNLNTLIDEKTAKAVTNKKVMKNIFKKNKIPTAKFKIIDKNFKQKNLKEINFPAVIKPLDSQGQRGVFKINSTEEVSRYFKDVLKFSREDEILIEEYYESNEITISGWVEQGKTNILTITDRITYEQARHIGICTAHIFPSRYLNDYFHEIENISKEIVRFFNIKNGPIYFQFLVGEEGIKVNEIACRIGGAYEADFIPLITGVDILEMAIKAAIGQTIDFKQLNNYNILKNDNWLSVQLFFANQGIIQSIGNIDEIKKMDDLIKIELNYRVGDTISKIQNATARAGYFIVKGASRQQLKENIKEVYDNLLIKNGKGENLVLRQAGEVL